MSSTSRAVEHKVRVCRAYFRPVDTDRRDIIGDSAPVEDRALAMCVCGALEVEMSWRVEVTEGEMINQLEASMQP
jgi:hypothetical protein